VHVGCEMVMASEAHSAELAIIISYPTSTSGIILKIQKTKLKLKWTSQKIMHKLTIFVEQGIMAHNP